MSQRVARQERPGKASVLAPANIAFVKYWGARDLARVVPVNRSISMTLSACTSHTTVEVSGELAGDEIFQADENGLLEPAAPEFARRIAAHLDTLRTELGRTERFRVATRNNFPSAAGIASSASGFAALTVAVTRALGLELGVRELSILARLSGSGSAARSVIGGYVEWPRGDSEADNHAVQLAPAEHWPLCDLVVLVETGAKEVSSLDGHRRAPTSPYFEHRLGQLSGRLDAVRQAIAERDLLLLGEVLEEEAIDLHLIAMSSRPPIFYWSAGTVAVLAAVRALRRQGLAAFSTMDAGANVHVICAPGDAARVEAELAAVAGVEGVLADRVGSGPTAASDLF